MNNKKTMQDMIPPEKRTIRRVSLGERKERGEEYEKQSENRKNRNGRIPSPPQKKKQRRGRGGWQHIALWVLGVVVLLFIILSLFPRASILVTPQQEQITVNGVFTATTEDLPGVVPFELLTVTRDGEEAVDVTGEKFVEAKASGTIIIFNDFNENNQRLVANTRFETPQGLIYRIQEPITVPGQTTNEENEVIPGSIEARVVADEPGEEYNIGHADFTLPGLLESGDQARYDTFFARSKTPMTGGFAGVQKTINEEIAAQAKERIDNNVQEELITALETELPEEFIVYNDGVFTSFTDLPQEEAENEDDVLLRRRGTLTAVAFNERSFASFIAENTSATYDRGVVVLEDPHTLTFNLTDRESFTPNLSEEFEFGLNGQATLMWELDEQRLKEDLAGKHRRDATMVLSGYPSVEEVNITLYPFWRRSFPDNIKNLNITYTSQDNNDE